MDFLDGSFLLPLLAVIFYEEQVQLDLQGLNKGTCL